MAKKDDLTEVLDTAVNDGTLAGYVATNPTGNKREWRLKLDDVGGQAVKQLDLVDLARLSTPEVRAFLAGAALGRTLRGRSGARRKPNPMRDAIATDGKVSVVIDADDQAEAKRQRTAMFNAAYSLGLRGRFGVRTVRDGKKLTLVGEVA